MSDDAKQADEGLLKAHTPPAADEIGAAVAALADAIGTDDAGQLDLLTGSPDLEPLDVLSRVAETGAAQRRARGRPKGSANKRNTMVFEYLEAHGHRDPAMTLSLMQSADTIALAKALGSPMTDAKGNLIRTPVRDHTGALVRDADGELVMEVVYAMADPVKVAQLQRQAASDLMPYKYAKKPQAIEVDKRELHVFLAGSLGTALQADGGGLFGGGQVEQYQSLSGNATVRPQVDESHEDAETLETQGVEHPRPTD